MLVDCEHLSGTVECVMKCPHCQIENPEDVKFSRGKWYNVPSSGEETEGGMSLCAGCVTSTERVNSGT